MRVSRWSSSVLVATLAWGVCNPWVMCVTRSALQCRVEIEVQLATHCRPEQPVAQTEFDNDARRKNFDRIADVLVAVGAALLDDHDLVDAGLLVAGEMRAQLLGGADAA